jgi:hypothetical protein
VEAAVLPRAVGLSVRRLRELARRELLARDPAAADRRRVQAVKTAGVSARATGEGMGEFVCRGPWAEVSAMRDAVDRYARLQKQGGDPRSLGVIRAEVARDLVLRPWDTTRPPVTAQLLIDAPLAALEPTVTGPGAAGGPAPTGSVDGQPVTAAHLKELLRRLDAYGVQPPPGGSLGVAIRDRAGRLLGTATIGELRGLVRRGCPTHGGGTGSQPRSHRRGRRARTAAGAPANAAAAATRETTEAPAAGGPTDEHDPGHDQGRAAPPGEVPVAEPGRGSPPGSEPEGSAARSDDSGDCGCAVPSSEDMPDCGCAVPAGEELADCGCAVLGIPEEVGRYRPGAEQRRFIRTRDRTCRQPGCPHRAGWADQDHVLPYGHGGRTDCANLCCLCRYHHRLKTHAPGWRFVMDPDGTLHVTTPSGVTRTSRPPGLDPPQPEPDDDDPPPF